MAQLKVKEDFVHEIVEHRYYTGTICRYQYIQSLSVYQRA